MAEEPATNQPERFPIVGIGASAGGLEAFSRLLTRLPADTGMGFVLVQHLDPDHESSLPDILSRVTTLPVHHIAADIGVEPNRIYVLPPNASLEIRAGTLHLGPRLTSRAPVRSIDAFLENLAEDQHEFAIGVVLSGAGSDGTLGLQAIKAAGGITFAQDGSARVASMPESAVAAGAVDFVLAPEEIAAELLRISRYPHLQRTANGGDAPRGLAQPPPRMESRSSAESVQVAAGTSAAAFGRILTLLRDHSGVDFSLYKPGTIWRRLVRRVVLNRLDSFEGYETFTVGNRAELDALYGDALISVTSFFRDPEAFEVLARHATGVVAGRDPGEPIRAWVIGCSTGQEAYSLAMVLKDAIEASERPHPLQVFASDLNHTLLDRARRGLYSAAEIQTLPTDRLRRSFVEEARGYRVAKSLREAVVFAHHNLLADPPFMRLDVICCRNVLIYLDAPVHRTLFSSFLHALRPGGILFLGASETLAHFNHNFAVVDKRLKIFAKRSEPEWIPSLPEHRDPATSRRVAAADRAARQAGGPADAPPEAADRLPSALEMNREADRVTVRRYAPPAVIVNEAGQVVQFRGPTGAFLESRPGRASFDLAKLARDGLIVPVRDALRVARETQKPARREGTLIGRDGTSQPVSVEVIPLLRLRERAYLIFFADQTGPALPVAPAMSDGAAVDDIARRNLELESALSDSRDYLDSLLEEHEAATEELQASNEEFQSTNEELQSINEELEATKEELESAIEELTTLNDELTRRNDELGQLNIDLRHSEAVTAAARARADRLFETVRGPLLVLDGDLRVERANPAFFDTFGVTADQVIGRSITALIDRQWDIGALRQQLESVIERHVSITGFEVHAEFRHLGGRILILNARPIDDPHGGGNRILLAMDDVTERQRNIEAMQEADVRKTEFLAVLAHELRNPLVPIRNGLEILRRALEDDSNAAEAGAPRPVESRRRVETALRMIDRQLSHIVRMVDDLMDMSRLNKGKLTLRFEPVDLVEVVDEAVSLARPAFLARDITLLRAPTAAPIPVSADPTRLLQVLGNLFTNVVKFTDRGGSVAVITEVAPATPEGRPAAVVRISDTGIGIPPEQLSRLFDLFVQVDASLERSAGGLGIGLTLVKNLVEMHGGSVAVHSEGIGRGTEVVIRLPLTETEEPSSPGLNH